MKNTPTLNMGQGGSTEFKHLFSSTVSELSQVQLAEIGSRFNELYKQSGSTRGRVIDREAFSNFFNLPIALGDRLFEAFDKKQNGSVDFEEFVCGLSLVLHGSFSDKCQLLFEIFNVSGDEGVSREELYTLLSAVVNSTSTILLTVAEGGVTTPTLEDRPFVSSGVTTSVIDTNQAITNIVEAAFDNCDISQSGKLLPLEFEYWLKRNPKVLDILLPSVNDLSGQEDVHMRTLVELVVMSREDKDEDIVEEIDGDREDDADKTTEGDLTMDEETNGTSTGLLEPPSTPNGDTTSMKEEEEEEEKHETTVDNEDLEQKDISLIHENLVEVPLNEEEIIPGEGETTDKRPQSISASRQTLELARQLSKDIQETMSPGSEESTSLATKLNEQTVDVDENILSAWIPHPWVQSVLASGKKVPPEHLTRPGLLTLTGQCDPIGDVLAATFPNVERKNQMTAESVKTDEEGLYTLITNGCYHAALNLTSMFLSAHGQGNGQIGQMTIHTYKTLQMWWARFSLLCHLDRYNEAYQEMEAFKELDQPDLYYQYNRHNYPGQIGSLVPYSMRILHAQLPFHAGNAQQSMNRLCLLQHSTENVLKHIKSKRSLPHSGAELTAETQAIAENIWTKRLARVKCILGSCLFRLKDYSLACQVYEDVIDLLPDLKPQLLSCIGRFCLTYGDCGTAEKHFEQVELLSNQEKSLLPLVYINNALIDIYKNQYSKAQQNFEAAAKIDVTPTKCLYNAAICVLYQGQLQTAISMIEDEIKTFPMCMQTGLFKTLFSLYELESSQAQAKKLSWLPLLGSHAPEGFNLMATGLIT